MVFLRRWPRVRHEMPYSSPVGGGSAHPWTQMTYHTFCFVLFVFGACIRMIFIDIHSYVFCFGLYLYMIFTDIPIYIYIYRNAWSLPQSCSVEGSHSHSIGKINKGIRENLLPSSLRFGAKPRHLAYTYIYIYIFILYGHDCHMITCFDVPMILCSANANEFPILCFGAYRGCIRGFLVVRQFWLT